MSEALTTAWLLAGALAVGLVLGTERGWEQRAEAEGTRPAGLRTFTLTALLGGVAGQLPPAAAAAVLAIAAAALCGFMALVYWQARRLEHDLGITTVVALLLALALGALAGFGEPLAAVAVAVVAALILYLKPLLHGWLARIEPRELVAGLQLLLISAVVLPLLPNRGMGPFAALNPFAIWLFVVLLSGLSFLGYLLTKLLGARRGIALAALCGGLVSSTAVTLTFARAARDTPGAARALAAGIVAASTIMLGRVAAITVAANLPLAIRLGPALATMLAVSLLIALGLLRHGAAAAPASPIFPNPFELRPALQMGALITAVMLLSKALYALIGDAGLWTVAAISGLADVDAITISAAQLGAEDAAMRAAAVAILVAVAANTIVKGVMVAAIERGRAAVTVALAYLLTLLAGAAVLLWRLPHAGP
jgi:uncharacterized membrane protein (DUF4010 family)